MTLVERSPVSHLCGANPLLMAGARPSEGITRSPDRLASRGVEVVVAQVSGMDLDRQVVETRAGDFPYDYLVVALGADYEWEAVAGAAHAHSFYEYQRTRRLQGALEDFAGGRVVVAATAPPYKCPPAPLEGALILDWAFRRKGVRERVELHVFIPEPAPLGVIGPEAAARVGALLGERGVELHTAAGLVAVEGKEAAFGDGSSLEADLIITVPPHRVPEVVAEAGLTDGSPWVPVDPETLETRYPGVFAIGDVNTIPLGEGRALPKAGVFASGEARVVASLIAARISGGELPPPYEGTGHCFLALSGEESALVGGTFLTPGGPRVSLGEPSAEGMRSKEQFERDWQEFRV